MDVLSDILRTLHLRAEVFLHACFSGQWAVDTSGQKYSTFHMVVHGDCWLHLADETIPEQKAIPLSSGDLVVFPHDADHIISNSQEAVPDNFPRNQVPTKPVGDGPHVSLICGYFEFDRHSWNPLLDAMPNMILIRGENKGNFSLIDNLGRFFAHEIDSEQPGNQLLINKYSEVLFIHVVRHHINNSENTGFITGLADEQIGRALGIIHEKPGYAWSVERLANAVGMSRSGFAERFNRLVEMPPMEYLTRWRMTQAYEAFSSSNLSVSVVAERLGYQSEVAFAKVFKKHFGFGPGKLRKEFRTQSS